MARKACHIIGFFSGGESAGRTTIVANLGAVLTKQGARCLMVDANVVTASLNMHVGLVDSPTSLQDVLRSPKKIPVQKATYRTREGLAIVPATVSLPVVEQLQKLRQVIQPLCKSYDYILIDAGVGLSQSTQYSLKSCDEVVIVTTPDFPSAIGSRSVAELAENGGKKIIGVIVNRSHQHAHELPLRDIEGIIGSRVIGMIPEDEVVYESLSALRPVVLHRPASPAAKAFNQLADYLIKFEAGMNPKLAPPSQESLLSRAKKLVLRR